MPVMIKRRFTQFVLVVLVLAMLAPHVAFAAELTQPYDNTYSCDEAYPCDEAEPHALLAILLLWLDDDETLLALLCQKLQTGKPKGTQPDPHWTIHNNNMIIGDSPTLRNDRFIPSIHAIMQAGNLYVFGINNPVRFADPSGLFIIPIPIPRPDGIPPIFFPTTEPMPNIPGFPTLDDITRDLLSGWSSTPAGDVVRGLVILWDVLTTPVRPVNPGIIITTPDSVERSSMILSNDITRSTHAQIRSEQGRSVSTVVNDVQRARPSDILIQDDGRWVVRGQHGRVHILEPGGVHVTTFNPSNSNVLDRVATQQWNRLTLEQERVFRESFSNYVNWR